MNAQVRVPSNVVRKLNTLNEKSEKFIPEFAITVKNKGGNLVLSLPTVAGRGVYR